jgi:hypothetical protein
MGQAHELGLEHRATGVNPAIESDGAEYISLGGDGILA